MTPEWTNALMGGALIGVAVSLMLIFNGRVTGISGIIHGLFTADKTDKVWRLFFIAGLFFGGLTLYTYNPMFFSGKLSLSAGATIAAGLLVGYGTTLGNGCTSGHGVCGISRLSIRSIVATLTFISAGIISVAFFKYIGVLS